MVGGRPAESSTLTRLQQCEIIDESCGLTSSEGSSDYGQAARRLESEEFNRQVAESPSYCEEVHSDNYERVTTLEEVMFSQR